MYQVGSLDWVFNGKKEKKNINEEVDGVSALTEFKVNWRRVVLSYHMNNSKHNWKKYSGETYSEEIMDHNSGQQYRGQQRQDF